MAAEERKELDGMHNPAEETLHVEKDSSAVDVPDEAISAEADAATDAAGVAEVDAVVPAADIAAGAAADSMADAVEEVAVLTENIADEQADAEAQSSDEEEVVTPRDDESGHTQARATVVLGDEEQLAAASQASTKDAKPSSSRQALKHVQELLGRMPNWVPVAGLTLIGAVVIVAVVVVLVLPPALTEEQVLSDFDAPSIAAEGLTNSVYASNSGYRLEDEEVVSISNNGENANVASVEATFVNESFEVEVSATLDYELSDRTWMGHRPTITSVKATPIAGVSGDAVLADIDTILSEGGSQDGVTLESVYTGGSFTADKSSLDVDEDETTSTIEISAERVRSLYEYSGVITATFEFVPGKASSDAGSWKLVSVSADENAYARSQASIVGTWEGTLEQTETSNFIWDIGRCWAAESTSPSLEVTAFDPDSGQMTCNLSFISHNHGALSSDADETDGDAVVEISGATIMLDPATLSGSWTPPTGDRSQGAYRLQFRNTDGVWRMIVVSGVAGSDGFLAIGYTTFTDTYVLERS